MGAMLKLTHITKKFGGLTAVDDVSLNMEEGTIHSLIGPNGAGKTTMVNLITGVYPATEGTVEFCGEMMTGLPTYQIARKGIGRTFQNIKVFPTMTLLENVMIGGHRDARLNPLSTVFQLGAAGREEKALRERAEAVLNELGMYDIRNRVIKNLPYGRQKISEIARAMMTQPKLILLDEPAAGLNPSERAELIEVIQKTHTEGYSYFLIEHNMDVVMSMSDRITVLNFGRQIAEGTPNEIKNNDEVITAYLGDAFVKDKETQQDEN